MRVETRRTVPVKFRAQRGLVDEFLRRCARRQQCLEPAFAFFGRLLIGKCGEFSTRYVAKIADQVHHLVIAERQQDLAARSPRFILQPHDEIHDPARVGAAIKKVPRDDERGRIARPAAIVCDDAGIGERSKHGVIGSVRIAHGDDALDAGPAIGGVCRNRLDDKKQRGDCQQSCGPTHTGLLCP